MNLQQVAQVFTDAIYSINEEGTIAQRELVEDAYIVRVRHPHWFADSTADTFTGLLAEVSHRAESEGYTTEADTLTAALNFAKRNPQWFRVAQRGGTA